MSDKNLIIAKLELLSGYVYYGLYFDNELVDISRCRIYVQKHRIITELIKRLHIRKDISLKERKDVIDELFKEGRLEIRTI